MVLLSLTPTYCSIDARSRIFLNRLKGLKRVKRRCHIPFAVAINLILIIGYRILRRITEICTKPFLTLYSVKEKSVLHNYIFIISTFFTTNNGSTLRDITLIINNKDISFIINEIIFKLYHDNLIVVQNLTFNLSDFE